MPDQLFNTKVMLLSRMSAEADGPQQVVMQEIRWPMQAKCFTLTAIKGRNEMASKIMVISDQPRNRVPEKIDIVFAFVI